MDSARDIILVKLIELGLSGVIAAVLVGVGLQLTRNAPPDDGREDEL